jgi:transposase
MRPTANGLEKEGHAVRGKRQRLAAAGTRNSPPEKVQDRLFQSYAFFDPEDLLQVKYAMLRRVARDSTSVSQAAHDFGFSRRHFYALQRQCAAHGFQGFVPHKRGPKGAYKLTDDVVDFIAKARAAHPSWNASALNRRVHDHFGLTVHPRSVERALARQKKARTS